MTVGTVERFGPERRSAAVTLLHRHPPGSVSRPPAVKVERLGSSRGAWIRFALTPAPHPTSRRFPVSGRSATSALVRCRDVVSDLWRCYPGVNRCCRVLPSANEFRAIHWQIHWQGRSAQGGEPAHHPGDYRCVTLRRPSSLARRADAGEMLLATRSSAAALP